MPTPPPLLQASRLHPFTSLYVPTLLAHLAVKRRENPLIVS